MPVTFATGDGKDLAVGYLIFLYYPTDWLGAERIELRLIQRGLDRNYSFSRGTDIGSWCCRC